MKIVILLRLALGAVSGVMFKSMHWVKNEEGEIILTANLPTLTLNSSRFTAIKAESPHLKGVGTPDTYGGASALRGFPAL